MTRNIFIALVCGAGLLGACFFGKPYYAHLMATRLMHAAAAAESRGDNLEAAALYSLSLQKEPKNETVLRSCADFLAKQHNPELLLVRERIANLEPNDTAALLDYIETALTFQKPKLARALLLNRAGEKAKEKARYYHLLSVSYFLSNDLPQADAASAEAVERDPANKIFRINQSTIRLACPDPAVREAALEYLEQIPADAPERATALNALLRYSVTAEEEPKHFDAWLESAQKCIGPKHVFFLSVLEALHRWRPAQFSEQLAAYTKVAAETTGSALELQSWLTKNGLYNEALAIRRSLPAATQALPECFLPAAEALFALQRRDELSGFLDAPEWKRSPALRLAWLERIRRSRPTDDSPSIGSEASWRKVLVAAGRDPAQLATLAELAEAWGWEPEREATLWAAADLDGSLADDALTALSRIYLKRGDASGFLRALDRQAKIAALDSATSANLAFTCFLLRREETEARRMIEDLCQRFPQSIDFTATNAFGHLRRGDIAGGLKLFENADTRSLVGTAPGVVYGLLLAANGDQSAAPFLKDAERWTHFPEEREIIAAARAKP